MLHCYSILEKRVKQKYYHIKYTNIDVIMVHKYTNN